ncbi:MAG: class III extradiol ring-cleavage dioxygenase [Rhodospirillales bacterium]
MLPSLFISHGSPMLPLRDQPARDFLRGLGAQLDRPKAILVASAHWDTERPEINAVETNDTIHDFYGFPPPLYALRYPAPGDAGLAAEIAGSIGATLDRTRGLDHGAWVPLLLMYPDHDIPVMQISLQSYLGTEHHLLLGKSLAALRTQGVLVIGSGGLTHNLRRQRAPDENSPAAPDVDAFADWMHDALTDNRTDDLLDYRRRAPNAVTQHPTDEHLLPLFVAMGAGGDKATRLHASTSYGVLRMDTYAFG